MPKPQRTRQHRTPEQQSPQDGVDRRAGALDLIDAQYRKYPRSHHNSHHSRSRVSVDRKPETQGKVHGKRALVYGALALTAMNALLYNVASNRSDDQSKAAIEAAVDESGFENEAILNSKIKLGELKLGEGVNLRHSPALNNIDGSTGDFDNNLAYTVQPGETLVVDDPLYYENVADGNAYYGFTMTVGEGEDQTSGLYWAAAQTLGQTNDAGEFYGSFTPTRTQDGSIAEPNFLNNPTISRSADLGLTATDPNTGAPIAVGTIVPQA